MATVSAWVSPRVNRPEPWARGSRPTSTEIGRISSSAAAVHADALVEDELADGLLVEQPNRLLLTRASRRAASSSSLVGVAAVRLARMASAIASLERRRCAPAGRWRTRCSRLAVASASGRARWLWAQLDAEEAWQVAELVLLGVRVAPRAR